MSSKKLSLTKETLRQLNGEVDAVNAGATVGEVCNLWRRVYGEYKEQVVV